MRGCPGESRRGGLMIDHGGVVLLGEVADAARAAHRTVAAMRKPTRERQHTVVEVTVRETSRTRRGVRNMITVLRVVSRAYEICIPLHHTESQIFDVTDAKNLGCRFPPILPLASPGLRLPAGGRPRRPHKGRGPTRPVDVGDCSRTPIPRRYGAAAAEDGEVRPDCREWFVQTSSPLKCSRRCTPAGMELWDRPTRVVGSRTETTHSL